MGVQIPTSEGAIFLGKGVPLQSIGILYGNVCKNCWTYRDALWVVGLDEPKESCLRWRSAGAEQRCHGNQFFGFRWAI